MPTLYLTRFLFVGLALAILLSPSSDARACELRLGWDRFEPFQMAAEEGDPIGLDMEIYRIILAKASCKISEYRNAPWTRLLHEIATGRIDVIMSANYTTERTEFGHYSAPYREVTHAAFVYSASTALPSRLPIATILRDRPMIGVYRNAYMPPIVQKEIDAAKARNNLYEGRSFEKMLQLVKLGRLGVMITEVVDPEFTFTPVREDPGFKVIEIDGTRQNLHYLYSRKSVPPETVARIDEAIKGVVGSDEYKRLFAKYLSR